MIVLNLVREKPGVYSGDACGAIYIWIDRGASGWWHWGAWSNRTERIGRCLSLKRCREEIRAAILQWGAP